MSDPTPPFRSSATVAWALVTVLAATAIGVGMYVTLTNRITAVEQVQKDHMPEFEAIREGLPQIARNTEAINGLVRELELLHQDLKRLEIGKTDPSKATQDH